MSPVPRRRVLPCLLFLPLLATLGLLAATSIRPQGAVVGTSYYVSASRGDDNADGRSPDTPWRTFSHLRNRVLGPGDRILLRRGDTWTERLTIHAAGSAQNWAYVGPYGHLADPAPRIRLENRRDDICVVVQDLVSAPPYNVGLNYIHIDNLVLSDSRIGLYIRAAVSTGNRGIRVTDCLFENMDCEPVMSAMLDSGSIAAELNMAKGDLDMFASSYQSQGGGGAEYVWPAAIVLGGRRGLASPTSFHDISLDNLRFEGCITGVLAYFYNLPSSTNFYRNLSMTRCTITGTVNGILAAKGLDAGHDGTPDSPWGRFLNLNILAGSENRGFALGTTGLILEDVANARFSDCSFSHVRNNGNPDGCGFDFESECRNITVERSIFADNDGQGILMMDNHADAPDGPKPHRDVTIRNCLFYDNLQNVASDRYRWDICIWNSGNANVRLEGNRHVSRVRTSGQAEELANSDGSIRDALLMDRPRSYGSRTDGITEVDASFRRNNTLTDFLAEVDDLGLSAALRTVELVQKAASPPTEGPTALPTGRPTAVPSPTSAPTGGPTGGSASTPSDAPPPSGSVSQGPSDPTPTPTAAVTNPFSPTGSPETPKPSPDSPTPSGHPDSGGGGAGGSRLSLVRTLLLSSLALAAGLLLGSGLGRMRNRRPGRR